MDFIFRTLHDRLKFLITDSKINKSESQIKTNDENISYFTIPYVPSISDNFKNYLNHYKDLGVRLLFCSLNKLSRFIKVHKDSLTSASAINIVYKINCNNCDASYVGQTDRKLQTRMNEHRNHIRRSTSNRSVIIDHRLEFNHEFDWNCVEILDNEPFLNKRLISEML